MGDVTWKYSGKVVELTTPQNDRGPKSGIAAVVQLDIDGSPCDFESLMVPVRPDDVQRVAAVLGAYDRVRVVVTFISDETVEAERIARLDEDVLAQVRKCLPDVYLALDPSPWTESCVRLGRAGLIERSGDGWALVDVTWRGTTVAGR